MLGHAAVAAVSVAGIVATADAMAGAIATAAGIAATVIAVAVDSDCVLSTEFRSHQSDLCIRANPQSLAALAFPEEGCDGQF
ncbi:MAG: hypothetical protein ACR2PF_17535 [Rhizobiaceae bacterium]